MAVRGIRGAITVARDTTEDILQSTRELLKRIYDKNDFQIEDIVSVLFVVTPDLKSAFPAEAARDLGWDMVPLLCFQDMQVNGALGQCIRVLVTINTTKSQSEIKHVYLREACKLRQDLADN